MISSVMPLLTAVWEAIRANMQKMNISGETVARMGHILNIITAAIWMIYSEICSEIFSIKAETDISTLGMTLPMRAEGIWM